MHHLHTHAFEQGEPAPRHDDHRSLYTLTFVMGLLIGADVLFGALGWETLRRPWGISLVLIAAILGALRIVYGAIEALAHGRIGADIALAQACLAALVIGQPFVAAEVVFIALVGEVLEAVTFARTERAIGRLLDQTPRMARVRRDGVESEVPAAEVAIGDLIIVRPGERVPVDGPVVAGRSTVDQAALTGESLPVDKGPGEWVYTGSVNQFGVLEIAAEKVGHETTFGQVLRLVAEAQRKKAPIERTADRLARYFLPVVEIVAGLTLAVGYWQGWPDVWLRTVAVLVVACPCALVLATPAAILASMAWLARHGVLIKGGAALERLAACDTFAFDKTGTLTLGRPELSGVLPLSGAGIGEAELLRLAATAEAGGRHPLAMAVAAGAAARGLAPLPATDVTAQPGAGVAARCRTDDGREHALLVGNRRLLAEHGITLDAEAETVLAALDARGETALFVALDGRVAGLVAARDAVRPEAHDVIHDLKHLKIREVALLTGDRAAAAAAVARKTHIKTVAAEQLPADKAKWIEERQSSGRHVAMVGDGINDAPALARAHAGIALGAIGADLAAEAGDFVILGEPLRVLPDLVKLARTTLAIIRQNIIGFAFGLNAVAMGSAALGWLGPVAAAILHQAGSLLVLLNAMRLLVFGDWANLAPIRLARGWGAALARLDDRLDPGRVVEALLRSWRIAAVLGLLVGLVICATWGWTAIGPGEVGLLQRQGRYRGVLEPGLHLRWPPPFERVTRLVPGRVRSLEIGFRTAGALARDADAVRWETRHGRHDAAEGIVVARAEDESLLLTGDGQFVELSATVQYHLDTSRPEALRAYAFAIADADAALRPLAEAAVRAVAARRPLEALLTAARHESEVTAAHLLQERARAYGLGLEIVRLDFQDAHPPLAVVDAYRDVSRAESDHLRRINEGRTARAEALAEARGRAAAIVNRAEAESTAQVARAGGEADAFEAERSARAPLPGLTDHRLYWETIQSALVAKPKVVLDAEPGRHRHLIMSNLPIPAVEAAAAAVLSRVPAAATPTNRGPAP
jgi:Cu+-exporting ATPase